MMRLAIGLLISACLMAALLAHASASPPFSPKADDDYVYSCCLSHDGKTLVIGGCVFSGGHWVMWDVETGNQLRTGRMNKGSAQAVAFSPDGKLLAAGGDVPDRDGGELKLLNAGTGDVVAKLSGHRGSLFQVTFTPDGKYLLSAGADDNMLRVWSPQGGRALANYCFTSEDKSRYCNRWQEGPEKPEVAAKVTVIFPQLVDRLYHFAVSPDGSSLAVTTGTKEVLLLKLLTGKVLKTFKTDLKPGASSVAFSPDGKTLAIGGGSSDVRGFIELWDVAAVKRQATFEEHAQTVLSLAFSPDGKQLVSGGFDGAKLWDLGTGKLVHEVHNKEVSVDIRFVSFLPDGKTFVSAGGRGPARFWDTATGKEVSPVKK